MSHDSAVLQAFEGSFRREKERWTGRRKDIVGKWEIEDLGLVKEKAVVQTVLQSGPLWLQTEKDVPRM